MTPLTDAAALEVARGWASRLYRAVFAEPATLCSPAVVAAAPPLSARDVPMLAHDEATGEQALLAVRDIAASGVVRADDSPLHLDMLRADRLGWAVTTELLDQVTVTATSGPTLDAWYAAARRLVSTVVAGPSGSLRLYAPPAWLHGRPLLPPPQTHFRFTTPAELPDAEGLWLLEPHLQGIVHLDAAEMPASLELTADAAILRRLRAPAPPSGHPKPAALLELDGYVQDRCTPGAIAASLRGSPTLRYESSGGTRSAQWLHADGRYALRVGPSVPPETLRAPSY